MAENYKQVSRMASSPPRRYRRPAQSCEACRRRKVRCNLRKPCSACLASRGSVACTYRVDPRRPSTNLRSSVESDVESSRQHRDESRLNSSANSVAPQTRPRLTAESQERLDGLEQIEGFERRLRHFEQQSIVPEGRSSPHRKLTYNGRNSVQALSERLQRAEQRLSAASPSYQVNSSSTVDLTLSTPNPKACPRLRHNPDKVKIFPSSHWLHTAEKFTMSAFGDKDVELSFVDTKAELVDSIREIRSLRRAIKNEQALPLNDPVPNLLRTIPPRPVCDQMVAHHMRTFELLYRVVHVPTFWTEYELYWSDPQAASTSFVLKLGLMLSIGIVFSADRHDAQLHRSSRAWIQAAQYWLVGPSEKSTRNLDGIQIFCLLLVSRQITSVGTSIWLSESSLLRMAMVMGLHRDPRLFHLPPFKAELRTRLWTTVLELVIHGSMDSSTPLLLSSFDFDGHIPHNIGDASFNADSKNLPSPHPLTSFTESSIPILMRQSLTMRMEAARIVQNAGADESYDRAIKLATELQKVCRDVATYSRLHWGRFLTMHHDFLDMQLRRYILLLHRPYMLRAREDPRFYLSRKICVESAMIIASYAERIRLPSDVLDDLSCLMIMSTGSFRGPLTLDVITVLGLDVINQLEETGVGSSSVVGPNGELVLDPLAELARAQRRPIVEIMAHIKEQLLQNIKLGFPTLKRYIFLAGVLSQIRAMELGLDVQSIVVQTALDALKECHTILQSFRTADLPTNLLQGFDYANQFDGVDFGTMEDSNFLDLSTFLYTAV